MESDLSLSPTLPHLALLGEHSSLEEDDVECTIVHLQGHCESQTIVEGVAFVFEMHLFSPEGLLLLFCLS